MAKVHFANYFWERSSFDQLRLFGYSRLADLEESVHRSCLLETVLQDLVHQILQLLPIAEFKDHAQ